MLRGVANNGSYAHSVGENLAANAGAGAYCHGASYSADERREHRRHELARGAHPVDVPDTGLQCVPTRVPRRLIA